MANKSIVAFSIQCLFTIRVLQVTLDMAVSVQIYGYFKGQIAANTDAHIAQYLITNIKVILGI